MTRQKLVEEAKSKGIDVPQKATRAEIARLLQAHDQNGSAPAQAPEVEQEAVNGLIVAKRVDEQGGISVDVVPIGNATVLEAPALLAMGLRAAKERVGME